MVAPLSDIQKQLSKLKSDTLKLRQELVSAYQAYSLVLCESVQSQMILVCFGLCTERHAEQFLSLTLTQRQTLQQDLQKLGIELGKKLIRQQGEILPIEHGPDENPLMVYEAAEKLETLFSDSLRSTSLAVNRLLEHHNILKIKSLETLFEIVTKADKAGRSITNPPLLVKAIIDTKDDEDEDKQVQPLTAIYLQIADLEFADAKLLAARQPIRQLMQKLNSLQKTYSQKLEEKTMAEAGAAWRASWFSYNPEN